MKTLDFLKRPEYIYILNLLAENESLKPQEIAKKVNEDLDLSFSASRVQKFLINLESLNIISRQKLEGQRQEIWFLNNIFKNETINVLKNVDIFDETLRTNYPFWIKSKKYEPVCDIMSIRDGYSILTQILLEDKHSLSEFYEYPSASTPCNRLAYFGVLKKQRKENHSCALVFDVDKNIKKPFTNFQKSTSALQESIYKFELKQKREQKRGF